MGSDGRSRMLKSMKPEHKPDARVLAAGAYTRPLHSST